MLLIFFIASIVISATIFLAKNKILNRILFAAFIALQIALSIYAYLHIDMEDSLFYRFDSLGVLLTLILTILIISTFYYSNIYLKRKELKARRESIYFAALIMFTVAMISAYFTENIAVLWASIEATTLFVSVLIFHERTKDALEAAWKYLFISSVGVALAFIGILFMSIIASKNGLADLNFTNLTAVAHNINTMWLKISFLLILTGFSVKISLFPLYAVAIDAKTVAASPVNALMSSALVNVGFIAIFRTYTIISHTNAMAWAQNILMFTGIISIFIAAIQLTRVKRLKRMYAFSTMEHMGIVSLGLAVGGIGYYAAILHLVFHSFVKAGLFYQITQIHTLFNSKWINDFGGFFKINPIAGLSLLVGFISITAMPPSGLFVSEFLIFKALFMSNQIAIAIATLILLTAIIYIFAKSFLRILYTPTPENIQPVKINYAENIIQFILFGLVIYLGINPPLFFTDLIHAAIAVLN